MVVQSGHLVFSAWDQGRSRGMSSKRHLIESDLTRKAAGYDGNTSDMYGSSTVGTVIRAEVYSS